jgi:hypothetical protein
MKAFLHGHGVKFSIYVDDGRISCHSKVVCHAQLCLAIHVLQLARWRVQWKKTITEPTQKLLHQGFITDSTTMLYTVTSDKWMKVHAELTTTAITSPLPVKTLASILGKLAALRRSHGLITTVMSRSLQHKLSEHVLQHGWTGQLSLSAASIVELQFLRDNLPSYHCRPIPTAAAASHNYDLNATLSCIAAIHRMDSDIKNLLCRIHLTHMHSSTGLTAHFSLWRISCFHRTSSWSALHTGNCWLFSSLCSVTRRS